MKSIPIYRLIDKEVPFNLPRSIILMTFLDTVRDTHPPPSENPLAVLRVSLLHTKSDCERPAPCQRTRRPRRKIRPNRHRKLTDKQKWQRLLSSLRYSLYVIFHPFDGFWDLSREKRGSLGAANIIVFLVLLVRLLSMQFTPFLFMNVYWPSVNIIQQCLAVLLPLLFFVAGNWGLTTLFEGKGTFKDVYIATCYALTPYVILQAAMILLANVITAKEGAFYYVLEGLSLGWSGALIICGMMQTHDYSLGKTLLFTIMTLLAMVVIIFLLLLFFSLVGDGIGYFVSLYKEVLFRLY